MTEMDLVDHEKTSVSLTKKLKKVKPIKARMSRNEIIQRIADETGLKRIDVDLVFDSLADLVKSHMKTRGSGEFMIPKIGLKIKRVRRKATKQRNMISPLTQQEVTIPSKPARWDIKLIALKSLKDALQ
jgi:nucleoid DNA-binding protein